MTPGEDEGRRDEAGDPACWLGKLCPGCDAVLDDPPPEQCPRCGRQLPPEP